MCYYMPILDDLLILTEESLLQVFKIYYQIDKQIYLFLAGLKFINKSILFHK